MSDQDPQPAMSDWATTVVPQRSVIPRPRADWSRRELAWIFILVALIWHVYNHLVETWISRIELESAMQKAQVQIAQMQQDAWSVPERETEGRR
ncbi:MAG TPA: hypothetical protein VN259_06825 [Xanthomonadales bacterium]|nr:hypothetical protein [Xanthomonadales bacterium]